MQETNLWSKPRWPHETVLSDVPICPTVDGDFDVSHLKKEYDLIILRVPEVPSTEMRQLISGNFGAKLAALWEGPFEFYEWLGSDAL